MDLTSLIYPIIETTLNSFDFTFCIIVNVLTYLITRTAIEIRDDKKVSTWTKRGILLAVILFTGGLYAIFGADIKLLLNSAIIAPVSWSWIFKPLCNKFNIDYKDIG